MQQTSRRRVLLAAVAAALVLAPVAGAWSWPADGPVLQPFVFDPAHPYAAGQHRGIDLGAEAGTVVVAPAPGTVTFAGTVPASGKSLTIATADGYAVTLTHLGSFSVAAGASVAEGDPVGTIGPSGEPELDQPYIHLGIRLAAAPEGYVDPLSLLPPKHVVGPSASPAGAGLAPIAGVAAVPASDPAPPTQSTPDPARSEPVRSEPVPSDPARSEPVQPEPVQPDPTRAAAAPAPVGVAVPSGRTPAPHAGGGVSNLTLVSRRVAASPPDAEHRPGGKESGAPASPLRPPLHLVASERASGVVAAAGPHRRRASSHIDRVLAVPPAARARHAKAGPVAARSVGGDRAEPRWPGGRGSVRAPRPLVAVPAKDHRRPADWAVIVSVLGGAALLVALIVRRRLGEQCSLEEQCNLGERCKTVRMMGRDERDDPEEDPGRTGLALCGGSPPPWARGGLRSPVRRLRSLPPLERQRRADGEWHRRARHAGDGRRRSRGEVLS
jgi:hypothetical protein